MLQISTARWAWVLASSAGLWVACGGQRTPVAEAPAPPLEPTGNSQVTSPAPVPSKPELHADVARVPDSDRPGLSLADWHARNDAQLNSPKRKQARIVVLGDSTANDWFESRSFQKQWSKQQPLNLALSGDQTPHLLWRIERGILDGLAPRLVLFLMGADGLDAGFQPEDTVRGIRAVLEKVQSKLPGTPVLLLALLPAGQHRADARRGLIEATNRQLSALAVPDKVLVVDVGGMFIEDDGSLSSFAMADYSHPTEIGHQALTTSVSLVAQQLMQAAR